MKGCCWMIGNGKNVRIWLDPWVPSLPNFRVPHLEEQGNQPVYVAELINHELKCWNMEVISQTFDFYTANAISQIRLGDLQQEDELIWTKSKSGVFSTKSVYQEIIRNLPSSSSSNPAIHHKGWNHFWKLQQILPKVQLFLWRLLHDGLGVAEKLHHIIPTVEDLCGVCGTEVESIDHVLLHCNHARACWLLSPLGIRTSELQGPLKSLLWHWMENWEHEIFLLAANLLWMIWKHRWSYLKEGQALEPNRTVAQAVSLTLELRTSESIQVAETVDTTMAVNYRDLLGDGTVLINVDGGVRNRKGVAAYMIRDRNGEFIRGESSFDEHTVVGYLEARAIHMGMMEALRMDFKHICVLSDAKSIVQVINNGGTNYPWQARVVVAEIRKLCERFEQCTITFVPRDHNSIADELVNFTFQCNEPKLWDNCPNCIQAMVDHEIQLF